MHALTAGQNGRLLLEPAPLLIRSAHGTVWALRGEESREILPVYSRHDNGS
jgi:hypothetical protein